MVHWHLLVKKAKLSHLNLRYCGFSTIYIFFIYQFRFFLHFFSSQFLVFELNQTQCHIFHLNPNSGRLKIFTGQIIPARTSCELSDGLINIIFCVEALTCAETLANWLKCKLKGLHCFNPNHKTSEQPIRLSGTLMRGSTILHNALQI